MLTIIPLLFTLCTSTWAQDTIYQTAIAVKQGVQDFTESIALGASSYNELVQKSKIFIDNSLFIKEALTTNQQWYIIGPRKYGKTLNVDMLKTFLEMRVDDKGNRITPVESSSAYKLFANGEITSNAGGATQKLESPLLISKHKDLVQKYLGNHPVVYISFKDVKGNTSEEVDATMGDTIKGAFLQHKYMIDILRRKKQQEEIDKPTTPSINVTTSMNATSDNTTSNLTRFEQILEDTHGRKFLEYDSIRYLTQVLYEHFNKTVFVIFDDFDKPFSMTIHMEQFPRMHYEDIIRYMDNLAAETFKQNNYLLNGIVVSTFQLHQYGNYHLWDIYTLVDLLMHSHPIIQYFGFSHKDVQILFDKHKVSSDLSQQAVKWYNGFKSFNSTRNTYNPHSIASFLQHKKLANYFNHQEERILAEKLIGMNLLTRNRFLSLVNGRHILIQRRTQLNEYFVLHLKIAKGIYAYRDFIWYLFRTGYLRATDDYMYFKIPNNEISEEISNWMISNYQREYNITENLLQDSATKLLEFVTDKSSATSSLEVSLSDLYSHCSYPNLTAFKTIPLVFDPYRLIFTTVALKMRSLSSYEINVYSNKTLRADAVIANNQTDQIFILEINHTDEPIDSSLKLAKKYEQNVTLFLNHLTKVKLVAVKIYPNKTVQIVSKLKDEVTLER